MTITSYPFDSEDTTESQYTLLFRELQDSGVVDTFGGTAYAPSADGSGMTVKLQPGFAIVRGHAVNSDALYTVTIDPATSQQRIDVVVLRLDPTANTILPAVVKGTPATSGPPVPALTQSATAVYELPIAQVLVGANVTQISNDKVTDIRRYVAGRVGAWSTGTRPTSPRKYAFGFNTTIGAFEFHDGTTWVALDRYRGSGTVYPGNPIEGDTFRRTDLGYTARYDGTQWIPQGPVAIYGKMWSNAGPTGVLAQNTATPCAMNQSRVNGGVVFDGVDFTLSIPVDGLYDLAATVYWVGAGSYYATSYVTRVRGAVTDAPIAGGDLHLHAPPIDGRSNFVHNAVPLKQGDKLKLTVYNYTGGGVDARVRGDSEAQGTMMHIRYVGPLNGATPL